MVEILLSTTNEPRFKITWGLKTSVAAGAGGAGVRDDDAMTDKV